jgi:hypothetical protein
MKNSIDLINLLYEKGLIKKEKNVYFVEEAFKINSFMKMCFREKNPEKLKRYIFLLQKYLAGAVNFHFKDDKIVIEKLPKEESLDAQEIL